MDRARLAGNRRQRRLRLVGLLGDASKARRELGWKPEVSFKGLVAMMVDADLEAADRERKAAS